MKIEIILVLLFVWNAVLSFLFWRILQHYRRLAEGVEEGNLEKVLGNVLKTVELNKKEIEGVKDQLKSLEKRSKFSLQKLGLLKFNPFSDLGGDQSFSLALLDDHDHGVVITSLHGRQTTRVYTKLVNGEKDAKLSEEEIKVIKKAKRIK